MVRPERFELPTCCSGGNRSIQLSYGRKPVSLVYMGWTWNFQKQRLKEKTGPKSYHRAGVDEAATLRERRPLC